MGSKQVALVQGKGSEDTLSGVVFPALTGVDYADDLGKSIASNTKFRPFFFAWYMA